MTEFVFRPSRRIGGKRVLSRLYSGRYSLDAGGPILRVALNTPDEQVARKRLRDLIVEKQREAEGLLAPRPIREAWTTPLPSLLVEYRGDLGARELSPAYLRDTTTRLLRIFAEAKWRRLGDVRPDAFVKWRSRFQGSAKTKKEYQISLNAFLNWLVKMERLERNPLAKVGHLDIRGKQVRPYRAFKEHELRSLFAVAGGRALVYQVLLYTGQRKEEVAALVWDDLNLAADQPFALFREGTTKDKDKRAVPLHPLLAAKLSTLRLRELSASPSDPAFPQFPTYKTLRRDLERAGIERKDKLGRVLHFHSFRKTWQTLGVRYGINQRVAQEVLGHSDANLTAKVYTDVPALSLHTELAKLPWLGADESAQIRAQKRPETGKIRTLVEQLFELVSVTQVARVTEVNSGNLEWSGRQDSNLRPPGPKPGALPG